MDPELKGGRGDVLRGRATPPADAATEHQREDRGFLERLRGAIRQKLAAAKQWRYGSVRR